MPDESQPPESPIHRAAHLGDIAALERLIAEGANVNARCDFVDDGYYLESVTPLMVAARSLDGADVGTLAWLLDHGADLYATSPKVRSRRSRRPRGVTAAWYAAGRGERGSFGPWHVVPDHAERLRFLLDSGLDPNEMRSNGRSLLVEACSAGDPAKVRLLLERGVSPFPSLESIDKTYLKMLEENRDTKGLSDAGMFFSYQNPLFCAAISGSPECIQLLLDAGVDLKVRDWQAHTALAYAGSPEVARLLIAAGARLDVLVRNKEDLLEIMLDGGGSGDIPIPARYEVAQVLLDAGVPLERTNEHGWTRLYRAAFRIQPESVEWLLAQGASLAPTTDNSTPLHGICWQGEDADHEEADYERIIRLLVAAGIPIEARDDEGRTPLHKAVGGDWENVTAIRTLLELGAKVDPMDGYGQTPLHLSANRGEITSIQILLAAGADPLYRDNAGKTPLDYAIARERTWRSHAAQEERYKPYWHEAVASRDALTEATSLRHP